MNAPVDRPMGQAEPVTRPTLARLQAIPAAVCAARLAVLPRRAALTALCLQLVLLSTFALLSAARPYETVWLKAALATWLVWFWPLARWTALVAPWRSQGKRERHRARAIDAVAAELDRRNPAAPDIFRTARHLEGHSEATLDALEALYTAWEPRLFVPAAPTEIGHNGTTEPDAGRAGKIRRRILVACAAIALLAATIPILLPSVFGSPGAVLYRMALPLRALLEIPAPQLEPVGVRTRIAQGDTIAVVVLTRYVPVGHPVHARLQSEVAGRGEEVRYTLKRSARGDTAWFRFGPVQGDLSLRFTALDASTKTYTIRTRTPPRLQAFSAVVTPPAYTRLPAETLLDFPPSLAVLPGTRIVWKGASDRSVAAWSFTWDEGGESDRRSVATARVSGSGSGSGSRLDFSRVIRHAGALRVVLADAEEEGGARALEGPWRIDLKSDAPPVVALLAPTGDGELARTLKVPLMFRVTDDFGVSRVRVHATVRTVEDESGREGEARVNVRDVTNWRDARDGTGGGVWDAAALRPAPGEVVELYLEALDNDAVSGPKSARSAMIRLRLPSEEEVRAAIGEREKNAATSLTSALERERRVRQEENKADRPDRAKSAEAPPIAGEWEVRRILSDQPRQHLQEVQAQLKSELKSAAKPELNVGPEKAKALEALRKDVEAMEKRLPPPDAARAPVAEQKRLLEALNRDQKALDKKLSEVRPPQPSVPSKASNPPQPDPKTGKAPTAEQQARQTREEKALQENRARLEEDLQRNMQEQKDLQTWLQEKERAETAQKKRLEEAARTGEQMQKDVEKALEEVKEAMEKGLENGDLSPDILEKMDRVRELLEEVLDQDEKDRLQREAGEQRPDAEDLQKAVRQLLEKKDGIRQDLERAIRMLEAMREMRALKELTGDLRQMEKEERALASELGKQPTKATESAEAMAERGEEQRLLEKRLDDALKEMDRMAKTPSMKSLSKDEARKAREAMKNTTEKLKAKNPDRKAAKAGADLAAKHLQAAAEKMEKTLASMEGGGDRAEVRLVLEETLEFTRWLNTAGSLTVPGPREWSPETGPEIAASARVAKWLATRMQRLAEKQPFETEVLRREAVALSAAADAVSVSGAGAGAGADGLRTHARNAARELLKWLNQPENSGGEDEGDGEGDSEFGGGESGESGKEGMSGRMRGVSGKQMAANQLTQELLRSMLRERQESGSSGGGQPGGSPGGKPQGQSGSKGSGGMPGGKPGGSGGTSGTGGSGSSQGSGEGQSQGDGQGGQGNQGDQENEGSEGESGRTGAAANAQQQIAKALESMAESADDAGGAARKLRQLAAEARALERALRGERLDPGEIQKRQEQFKTKLLEAADAMEERGQQQERRAEAWTGGVRIPEKTGSLGLDSLAVELKRRRAEARRLPLSPEQKQRVEWYYERLLGP